MNRKAIGRRSFFFGCFAAASCRNPNRSVTSSFPEQLVSIARVASYSADITGVMKRILLAHRVPVASKRIVLKPKLVDVDAGAPINNHVLFVASAVEAFQSLGAADVRIAEGPGHRRMTLDLADAAGYFREIASFENRFTDLNLDEVKRVTISNGFSRLKELSLPET